MLWCTMDLQHFFEILPETQVMGEREQELLSKIMAITNPMDFDDSFATDEELEALETSLDALEVGLPEAAQFKAQIAVSKAVQSSVTEFI